MIKRNKFKQILLTTTLLTTVNALDASAANFTPLQAAHDADPTNMHNPRNIISPNEINYERNPNYNPGLPQQPLERIAYTNNPTHWENGARLAQNDNIVFLDATNLILNENNLQALAPNTFNVITVFDKNVITLETGADITVNTINAMGTESSIIRLLGNNHNTSSLTINHNISGIAFIDINAGSKIIFNNNANIDFNTSIITGLSQGGVIIEQGDVVFNNTISSVNSLATLTINNGRTATLRNNARINDIQLNSNPVNQNQATLILDSTDRILNTGVGIHTDLLADAQDDQGKLIIRGDNQINQGGDIGSDNIRIADITIEDVTNAVIAANPDAGKVTFKNEIFAKKISVGNRNVVFNDDVDMFFRDPVGNITDRGELEFTNNGTVTLNKNFQGDIRTKLNDQGNVVVNHFGGNNGAPRRIDWSIGAAGSRLSTLTTDGNRNINFNQAIHARNININGNHRIKFNNRVIDTNQISLNHQRSTIHFVNGLQNRVNIVTTNANYGSVNFKGNNNSEVGSIGTQAIPLHSVVFGAAIYNLNADIYTQNIAFDAATQFTVANPNITITTTQIGGAAVAGVVNLPANLVYNRVTGKLEFAPAAGGAPAGGAAAGGAAAGGAAGGAAAAAGGAAAHAPIYVAPAGHARAAQLEAQQKATSHIAHSITSGKVNLADVKKQLRAQGVDLKDISNPVKALSDDINKTATKAQQAQVYIASIIESASTDSDLQESTSNNQKTVASYSDAAQEVTSVVTQALGSRISNISIPAPLVAAAGDDDNNIVKGVWTSGFFGANKQSASKDSIGYKGTVAGGSLGVDFDITDNSFVGISYSNAVSNIKLKQKNSGGKINATSHILGLYGQHQLNDKISLKAILTAGKTKVNSKRIVNLGGTKATASAKINNTSYGIETSASYLINASDNISVTPNIGFRYGHYKDSAFTEKGVGVHNITVKGKSYSEFTGIVGTGVAFTKKISDDLTLIPSMNASIEHSFKGKQAKTKAKFTWMEEYFESAPNTGKKANTSYNLGASLLAKHKNIDLSASYNTRLKKKFIAHQGSLQLKVNF